MSRATPDTDETPTVGSPRNRAIVAGGLLALYVVASGLALWLGALAHSAHAPPGVGALAWLTNDLGPAVVFAAFAVTGTLIVSHRPRNTVGWVMVIGAVTIALARLAGAYAQVTIGGSPADPTLLGLLAAWIEPGILQGGYLLAIVFLPLVYPRGELPSARWRAVWWTAGAWAVISLVDGVLRQRLTATVSPIGSEPVQVYDVANPLALEWTQPITAATSAAAPPVLVILLVAAAAGVFVRFRRSSGSERQQMKWFVSAAAAVAFGFIFTFVVTALLDLLSVTDMLVTMFFGSMLLAYPIAVGLAVLRYRLYEIDRIVSRTVAYGLVVVVLAGVYVVGVVGLGAALTAATGTEDSDVAVALATLAVAGLFRPVSSRARTAVDRRFNRTGYQARLAVDAFTDQLRDEVDLDRIAHHTAHTAAIAAEPTHLSIWLLDIGGRR